jgi:hypothetical protein
VHRWSGKLATGQKLHVLTIVDTFSRFSPATRAAQYPRYGYRRIRILLGRDGHRMSVGG